MEDIEEHIKTQQVFDQAVENGWEGYSIGGKDTVNSATLVDVEDGDILKVSLLYTFPDETTNHISIVPVYMIIFQHSFAKAFWGEDWRYYLQQIVLKKEPIEYLSKFL